MDGIYEHGGQKIIVDFVEHDEVYYRKFRYGDFVGMFRMPEIDFINELENNGIEVTHGKGTHAGNPPADRRGT